MSSQSFNEQAYVVWRNFVLSDKRTKSDTSGKKFARKNTGILVHKVIGNYHPSELVSKMFKPKRFDLYKDFLDLETHKLTSLVPEYTFYKIDENSGVKIPFYFQTAADEITRQSILEIPTTRAVGVKSFGVEFIGKDTATAKKMLNFNLEIFSDNMKNIFVDAPVGYARIAELFTIFRNKSSIKKSGFDNVGKPASQVRTASSSEIAVDIGYSIPRASRDLFTPSEVRTINNSKLSLRLTYTNHDINLESDGRTTISISYSGRILNSLNETSLDLLSSKDEKIALNEIHSHTSQKNTNTRPDKANPKQAEKQNQKEMQQNKARRRTFFRGVIEKLESKGLVYDYNLKQSDIDELQNFQEAYAKSLESDSKQQDDTREVRPKPKSSKTDEKKVIDSKVIRTVSYIHLGDLIMQVAESLHADIMLAKKKKDDSKDKNKKEVIRELDKRLKALQDTRILSSNMYVKVDSPMQESISVVNISDVPISLSLFQKYYFDYIEQEQSYSLTMYRFLQDCVQHIVPSSFKNHVYKDAKFLDVKTSIKSTEITGEKIEESKDKIDTKSLPDFIAAVSTALRPNECDYFIMYADHTEDISLSRRGSRLSDLKDGIYHFYLGRNRGVLKQVNFSKMDIKYRKEALIVKSVSLYDQLKMPYNADITMFGNVAFFPGSLFFIDPSSVGMGDPRETNSAAFQLGLGGYYQATSVSITFDGTKMETGIQATQVSWAEDQSDLIRQLDSYIDVKNTIGSL